MASNEEIIIAGQAQTAIQASNLQDELDVAVAALQAVAELTHNDRGPSLSYSQSIAPLAAYLTAVTGTYAQGLTYPLASDLIDSSLTDGYNSAFLTYMQGSMTGGQTWATQIQAIKVAYSALTTTAAQTLASTILPALGNAGIANSANILQQVNDKAAEQTAEEALLWTTIAQDLLLEYQQKHHAAGIGIEEIRAKIYLDMIKAQTGYNDAILAEARKNLSALREMVSQIRERISHQIQVLTNKSRTTFDRVKLSNRAQRVDLDAQIAEIRDDVRRNIIDYTLQLGQSQSYVNYINDALTQVIMSTTLHGNYTNEGND